MYAVDGEIQLKHITNNYVVQTGENELSVGLDGDYYLPMGIPEGDELMIIHGQISMSHRTLAEYLFPEIASWLKRGLRLNEGCSVYFSAKSLEVK